MSGKDLLAVLLMIFPGLLVITLVTFALVQYSGVAAGPKAARDGTQAGERTAKAVRMVTQKRLRDPWERPVYAKTSSAPQSAGCDARGGNPEAPCF